MQVALLERRQPLGGIFHQICELDLPILPRRGDKISVVERNSDAKSVGRANFLVQQISWTIHYYGIDDPENSAEVTIEVVRAAPDQG
jgi:hypothetical protein